MLQLEARTNTHRDTEIEGKVINHDDSDKWHHQWGLHADRKHTLVHEHTNTAGTLRHSSGLFLLTFPPAIELWTFTEKKISNTICRYCIYAKQLLCFIEFVFCSILELFQI